MSKPVLSCIVFSCLIKGLTAQTLVTKMGHLMFFNSLDSAKSAWITAIAKASFCLLDLADSSHSIEVKLDLDLDTGREDSAIYRLDFNILSGNYTPPIDSAMTATDAFDETPGIYIQIRDSFIRPETILRLLDYGIGHYKELKTRRQTAQIYECDFIHHLLAQKPSPKLRRELAQCK